MCGISLAKASVVSVWKRAFTACTGTGWVYQEEPVFASDQCGLASPTLPPVGPLKYFHPAVPQCPGIQEAKHLTFTYQQSDSQQRLHGSDTAPALLPQPAPERVILNSYTRHGSGLLCTHLLITGGSVRTMTAEEVWNTTLHFKLVGPHPEQLQRIAQRIPCSSSLPLPAYQAYSQPGPWAQVSLQERAGPALPWLLPYTSGSSLRKAASEWDQSHCRSLRWKGTDPWEHSKEEGGKGEGGTPGLTLFVRIKTKQMLLSKNPNNPNMNKQNQQKTTLKPQ